MFFVLYEETLDDHHVLVVRVACCCGWWWRWLCGVGGRGERKEEAGGEQEEMGVARVFLAASSGFQPRAGKSFSSSTFGAIGVCGPRWA